MMGDAVIDLGGEYMTVKAMGNALQAFGNGKNESIWQASRQGKRSLGGVRFIQVVISKSYIAYMCLHRTKLRDDQCFCKTPKNGPQRDWYLRAKDPDHH